MYKIFRLQKKNIRIMMGVELLTLVEKCFLV